MSTADIVLPSLSKWTENLLTAIYNATSAETSDVLDKFLSKHAVIRFNGKEISRNDLVIELQGENLLEVGVSINFLGVVEVPAKKDPAEAGSVGTFFTVTVQGRDRDRVAPVRKIVTASLNVVIEQDFSIPVPPTSSVRGNFDRRRVKEVNIVVAVVPVLLADTN